MMETRKIMCKTAFLLFFLEVFFVGAWAQINWPNGKKAAIVLTYDDGLKSHRNIVMPQLEAKNLRGTFFLYGQMVKKDDIVVWREASKRGHELGNHSLFHPCLAGSVDTSSSICRSLECYSVKDMLTEIEMMNSFLFAIDGKSEHAYAYPCGHSVAGDEEYSLPLINSGLAKYCRGASGSYLENINKLHVEQIPSFPATPGCKGEELIEYVQAVLKKHALGIIVFHGVGGDYLTVDAVEHQKLVDFLASHLNEIWVGTFTEVLDYIATQAKE